MYTVQYVWRRMAAVCCLRRLNELTRTSDDIQYSSEKKKKKMPSRVPGYGYSITYGSTDGVFTL
jgi:hypothetical protein